MSTQTITLSVELTHEQAQALALFCKRAGFMEFSHNASSEPEAYAMRDAQMAVGASLAKAGYNPR
ncbi:DUF7706 family protein [Gilvimarinus sp. 1_MG-2023]|uniref:DUF7706 family protein n=1 Tax=Gilvimarinus sp. 1_MG-2023 TaxID=3062638 RepID=UPI0026E36DC5|nr:hypothetical protein [Gilvimarinus sp. 1_MG-2023]MDO6747171.1 hypothetical protein [Gilvimarinus sp. 1_MG-2023]